MNLRIRQTGGVVWFTPDMHVTYRPRHTLKALVPPVPRLRPVASRGQPPPPGDAVGAVPGRARRRHRRRGRAGAGRRRCRQPAAVADRPGPVGPDRVRRAQPRRQRAERPDAAAARRGARPSGCRSCTRRCTGPGAWASCAGSRGRAVESRGRGLTDVPSTRSQADDVVGRRRRAQGRGGRAVGRHLVRHRPRRRAHPRRAERPGRVPRAARRRRRGSTTTSSSSCADCGGSCRGAATPRGCSG